MRRGSNGLGSILSFSGNLPEGLAGNNDARFMSYITGQFVSLVWPNCVIFDFRQLGYTFGNYLLGLNEALDIVDEGLPVLYVVSEKCRVGLSSHLAPGGGDTSGFIFEEFNVAMDIAPAILAG